MGLMFLYLTGIKSCESEANSDKVRNIWQALEEPLKKSNKRQLNGKKQRQHNGERIVFSTNDIKTTGHPQTDEESRHRPCTCYRNLLKMDHRSKE